MRKRRNKEDLNYYIIQRLLDIKQYRGVDPIEYLADQSDLPVDNIIKLNEINKVTILS